jgi:hypothetical protein
MDKTLWKVVSGLAVMMTLLTTCADTVGTPGADIGFILFDLVLFYLVWFVIIGLVFVSISYLVRKVKNG